MEILDCFKGNKSCTSVNVEKYTLYSVKADFFVKTFVPGTGSRVVHLLYMALIKGFARDETFLLLYGSHCQLGSSAGI